MQPIVNIEEIGRRVDGGKILVEFFIPEHHSNIVERSVRFFLKVQELENHRMAVDYAIGDQEPPYYPDEDGNYEVVTAVSFARYGYNKVFVTQQLISPRMEGVGFDSFVTYIGEPKYFPPFLMDYLDEIEETIRENIHRLPYHVSEEEMIIQTSESVDEMLERLEELRRYKEKMKRIVESLKRHRGYKV